MSPKSIERLARDGRIPGAKKNLAGRWVVDLSEYYGVNIGIAVNDTGLEDAIFNKLESI